MLVVHVHARIRPGRTEDFLAATLLAVPGLAAFGLRAEHADDVAAKAMTSSSMQGNPVTLSHGELNAIVLQSL